MPKPTEAVKMETQYPGKVSAALEFVRMTGPQYAGEGQAQKMPDLDDEMTNTRDTALRLLRRYLGSRA